MRDYAKRNQLMIQYVCASCTKHEVCRGRRGREKLLERTYTNLYGRCINHTPQQCVHCFQTVDSVEVAAETRSGSSQTGNERLNLTVYF